MYVCINRGEFGRPYSVHTRTAAHTTELHSIDRVCVSGCESTHRSARIPWKSKRDLATTLMVGWCLHITITSTAKSSLDRRQGAGMLICRHACTYTRTRARSQAQNAHARTPSAGACSNLFRSSGMPLLLNKSVMAALWLLVLPFRRSTPPAAARPSSLLISRRAVRTKESDTTPDTYFLSFFPCVRTNNYHGITNVG